MLTGLCPSISALFKAATMSCWNGRHAVQFASPCWVNALEMAPSPIEFADSFSTVDAEQRSFRDRPLVKILQLAGNHIFFLWWSYSKVVYSTVRLCSLNAARN